MSEDLDDLGKRLEKIRKQDEAKAAKEQKAEDDSSSFHQGMRAGSELIFNTLVGALLGYFLDQWLGTAPIFLLVFVMVGMFAAFRNIYRLLTPEDAPAQEIEKKGDSGLKSPSKTAKQSPNDQTPGAD